MTYLFDTNFLCALINKNDVHHLESQKIIEQTQPDESYFIVPSLVAAEMLISDIDDDVIMETCFTWCDSFTDISESEIELLKILPKPLRKQLKAFDCLILALTISHDAQLLTFDLKLERAYHVLTS